MATPSARGDSKTAQPQAAPALKGERTGPRRGCLAPGPERRGSPRPARSP
ncbi:hypothetical protein LG3211_5175 [Lysobacter gummosus]|nr:hypothetical protein LG3211_5175 [Lysobacter gummosus]